MRRQFPSRSHGAHAVSRHRHGAGTTWEVRTFVVVSAAICAVFLLTVLYLSQATAVATRGYEAQRLEQQRDELRRQNALLEGGECATGFPRTHRVRSEGASVSCAPPQSQWSKRSRSPAKR
jgi:hypothetical protein